MTYQHLSRDVQPGARILINDGLVELIVERISGGLIDCKVIIGGKITSHKGINLPGTRVSAPTLTDKDREDIRFGVAQDVDYIALSFVRGPQDIMAAKKLVVECGGTIPIIAKIERQEAMTCLSAILEEADGVMIARGDLGVEMGPEAIPILQKRIIAEANRRRCLVITATQMLESMTQHLRPTRAEASDVANAVFDGTDAVMLSAETAIGSHPVETVEVMDRIIRAAEEGSRAWCDTQASHRFWGHVLARSHLYCGILCGGGDRCECDYRVQRTGQYGPLDLETAAGCADYRFYPLRTGPSTDGAVLGRAASYHESNRPDR